MIFSNPYRRLAWLMVIAVVGGISNASASSVSATTWPDRDGAEVNRDIRLTHPSRWANDNTRNQPTIGDATSGSVGGDSWRTNRDATNGDGMHALYFQGNTAGTDPTAANPATGDTPQLLFDPSASNNGVGPRVGDITRIAWDTNRSRESTAAGDWFFDIITASGTNLNYALTDDTNYRDGEWNTLEANKNPASAEGNNEVRLYNHKRATTGDHDTYQAKTLADWASSTGDEVPAWWDEPIESAFMATANTANDGASVFDSNLDNLQFEYATADGIRGRTMVDLATEGALDVPAPRSLFLLGIGLTMLLVLALRRNLVV